MGNDWGCWGNASGHGWSYGYATTDAFGSSYLNGQRVYSC